MRSACFGATASQLEATLPVCEVLTQSLSRVSIDRALESASKTRLGLPEAALRFVLLLTIET